MAGNENENGIIEREERGDVRAELMEKDKNAFDPIDPTKIPQTYRRHAI